MPNLEKIVKASIEARKLRTSLQAVLKSRNLSYAELEVLYVIGAGPKITPSDIATSLSQERATISRCIKVLAAKSLINYDYDTEDRRTVFVSVSRKGKNLLNSLQ